MKKRSLKSWEKAKGKKEKRLWLGLTLSLCGLGLDSFREFLDNNEQVGPTLFPTYLFPFFFWCGNGDFIPSINKKGKRKWKTPRSSEKLEMLAGVFSDTVSAMF